MIGCLRNGLDDVGDKLGWFDWWINEIVHEVDVIQKDGLVQNRRQWTD